MAMPTIQSLPRWGRRWSKSTVVLDDVEETVKKGTGTGSLEQKIASFQPWF